MNAHYPTVETLLADACERTGLDDFGAPAFLDGMRHMRESLIADAPFNAEDQAKVVALIGRRLANRLKIEAWFKANPTHEDAPIEGPLSIVGLPRTGTTALGNMLSLDPRFRPLRPWEQEEPCPPPRIEDEGTDPRRLAYRDYVAKLLQDAPEQAAMHLWDADATLEDTEVLGLEFRSQQMTLPIWRYHAWWRSGDMRRTFAYHARVCRLLQSARPPSRWLFKAPHHKFHLDHIVEGYPGIRFVFTHRDPAKTVPSYASFVASLYPAYVTAAIGKVRIGHEIHNHLLTGMRQAMAARAKLGPERFLDVHHAELVADPIGVAQRIYDWLGYELTDPVREAFIRWRDANRSGTHGEHHYTAEQYGLAADAIRGDYAEYIRDYDV